MVRQMLVRGQPKTCWNLPLFGSLTTRLVQFVQFQRAGDLLFDPHWKDRGQVSALTIDT